MLTLSTLQTSGRLYDWLIEHQQPGEILHHSPGLYFPFLLKFLLTHSPRAFKPSLISFRAPWFDQSNLCAVFWSHFVARQCRHQSCDVILKMLGSSLHPKSPSLTAALPPSPYRHTWVPQWTNLLPDFKTSYPFEILNISRKKNYQSFVAQWCWVCWRQFWVPGELSGGGDPEKIGSWGKIYHHEVQGEKGIKKGPGSTGPAHSLSERELYLGCSCHSLGPTSGFLSTNEQKLCMRLWWDQVHHLSCCVKQLLSSSPSGFVVIFILQLLFVEEATLNYSHLSFH